MAANPLPSIGRLGGMLPALLQPLATAGSEWVAYTADWDPSFISAGAGLSWVNRRLTCGSPAGGSRGASAITGKMFGQIAILSNPGGTAMIGIANSSAAATNYPGQTANSWGYYALNGNKYNNGDQGSYGPALAAGDIITWALDKPAGKLWWSRYNGYAAPTDTAWPNSGNPLTGANPAFSNVSGVLYPFCADAGGTGAASQYYMTITRPPQFSGVAGLTS